MKLIKLTQRLKSHEVSEEYIELWDESNEYVIVQKKKDWKFEKLERYPKFSLANECYNELTLKLEEKINA